MRQVIVTICCVCKTNKPLACYDSERQPKKMRCVDCTATECPTPTAPFSHGFCVSCAEKMEIERRKRQEAFHPHRRRSDES